MDNVSFDMLRFLSLTTCILFAVGLFGCKARYKDIGFDDRPDANSLVGVWRLTSESNRLLAKNFQEIRFTKLEPNDNYIELRIDGTCTFRSYWAFDSDASYLVSEGTWKILNKWSALADRNAWFIEFSLSPDPIATVGTEFLLDNRDGKVRLVTHIGDPDLNELVIFQR